MLPAVNKWKSINMRKAGLESTGIRMLESLRASLYSVNLCLIEKNLAALMYSTAVLLLRPQFHNAF